MNNYIENVHNNKNTFIPAYISTTVSPVQDNWAIRSFSDIFPALNIHLVTSNVHLQKYICYKQN